MRIYALMVAAVNPTDKNAYIYSRAYNLDSFGFFARGPIKESFKFLCRESVVLPALGYGTRHTVIHEEEYTVHIQVSEIAQLAVFAFCDSSYPKRVAFKATDDVLLAFEKKNGEEWVKYQKDENIDIGIDDILKSFKDPRQNDALVRAQEKSEEVKVILHENIRKLLENGQNLEKMVEKSKDLSAQSKMFFKDSKKMKKCCNIF